MLTLEQKEEVIETVRVELEKMLFTMEEHFRREGTPDHVEYFAKIEESWRMCLKRECDSFNWIRNGVEVVEESTGPRKDEWFIR